MSDCESSDCQLGVVLEIEGATGELAIHKCTACNRFESDEDALYALFDLAGIIDRIDEPTIADKIDVVDDFVQGMTS